MKKNVWIAPIVLVLALILNSCGTQQKATAPVVAPVAQEPVVAVEPLKEVISIADALEYVSESRQGRCYYEEVWL